MNTPAQLTDPFALASNRARTNPDAMFLHHSAVLEVQDRLAMVNRSFTSPAIVTPFPDIWKTAIPSAVIVPDQDFLELKPGAHDLVVHAMCLHWSNDPVGQLIQCKRALKPDGLMIAALFGGQTLTELRAALSEAEIAETGGLSPRVAPMGEIRELGALLQRAGFALPVADSTLTKVKYASFLLLLKDLRSMGESNALMNRLRHPTKRAVFDTAARLYQQNFGDPDGRTEATFEQVFLTGWAPDVGQPKALRPGSARQRLADALSVTEMKLPD